MKSLLNVRISWISTAIFVVCYLPLPAAGQTGEALYQRRCAACHDQSSPRIPSKDSLQKLPASRILRAMNSGAMMTIAYTLKRDEREAVAAFLGKAGPEPGPAPEAFCKDRAVTVALNSKSVWNGWSPTRDNARFLSTEAAGLAIGQVRKLKLKWAFGFDGDISSYAQPSVIGNQVFVGSAAGVIYALKSDSGCIQWSYQAGGPVRSAMIVAPLGAKQHALLFGDLTGTFYALEAESGKVLWKKKADDHEAALITGAATVNEGVVYVPVASWEETRAINPEYPCCTFRGSIVAFRIRDGRQVWKTYTISETPREVAKSKVGTVRMGPSGAGVWGAPTVDLKRHSLYVATGDNYSPPSTQNSDAILALDLATGKIVWSKQTTPGDVFNSACVAGVNGPNCSEEDNGPDHDFGGSILRVTSQQGRELLLAGQKSGVVYALDPDKKGEILWQTRVGKGGVVGGVQWGMASDGQNVYAATSDAYFYTKDNARHLDPAAGGGLTALRLSDGSKAWYVPPVSCGDRDRCSPAQSAAVTAIPGVVFSGSVDGHLRAYSSEDGSVLWDFNAVRSFETVNHVSARGGSFDGPGPVIANGMIFVNSGYSRYGGEPGNVLLAFTAEE
jgi:polyvinyl alcohol dehydrogenase (cytochrome)